MEKRLLTLAAVLFAMAAVVPEVSAKRWLVGKMGWTTQVNYTLWAQDLHFYNGDWLYFVYDRNQMNVLEVNKADYESCNADHPLKNWTRGAGRDVVPLNVTRDYYFVSGRGFCFGGMKLALRVENLPPPPVQKASPVIKTTDAPSTILCRRPGVRPAVFAIGALWDAFVRLWQ
ncbi:unnamed protein product [Linum tenue]|uniref:Phytocyanin domain-containing protein n=1 Tax=Linum tenue TaxID=586396 RepID=A0AAV0N6F0_9ROSI|nr:unnamed protein product [Linum tenue]